MGSIVSMGSMESMVNIVSVVNMVTIVSKVSMLSMVIMSRIGSLVRMVIVRMRVKQQLILFGLRTKCT